MVANHNLSRCFVLILLFCISSFVYAEQHNANSTPPKSSPLTGRIIDENGDPLIGAAVMIKGTQVGVESDQEGKYSLMLDAGLKYPVTVVVSYVGFKNEEKVLNSAANRTMDFKLKIDNTLNDLVVVGYGTQKKINVTGAVSQISTKDMKDMPIINMTQALQGQVPNLNITFGSGKPGTSGTLNIRGTTSINGGSPLVLIDGIPGDMDHLNVNDVASVSVLKDASASAVYGAQAAFGVILVTTKLAKKGKININYSNNIGWSTHASSTDFVRDAYTNSKLNDEAFYNDKGSHLFHYSDAQWNELYMRRNDMTENPARPWVVVESYQGKDRYNYYGNFDWFNYFYRKYRPKQNYDLSVSGASDNVRYLISGNYSREDGIFRIQPDVDQRYNMMSKIDIDASKWLTISNTTRYFNSDYSWKGFNQSFTPDSDNSIGSSDAQFYSAYYHYHPQYVPINPDGTLTGNSGMSNYTIGFGLHAIQLDGKSKGEERTNTFQTTFQAVAKVFNGFTVTANYTYLNDLLRRYYRSVKIQYSLYPGELSDWNWDALNRDQLTERTKTNDKNVINIYGNYNKSFGKHNISAMLGFNQELNHYKSLITANKNLLSETLNDLSLAIGDAPQIYGDQNEYALRGAFGRINYDYFGKYLFEVSGRYDGTSRFPKSHRFTFFPSFSVGYRISEEKFFEPLKHLIPNLKFRYSHGTLGNQEVSNYAYVSQMSVSSSSWLDSSGDYIKQTSCPSPVASSLTWEKVTTDNVGLDLDMFNGQLGFTADVYQRKTTGMLTQGKELPSVFGASAPKENAADLRTRGYELSLSWKGGTAIFSKEFRYGIKAILSDYQAEITKFDNPTGLLSEYRVGEKLGEIWGYHFDGYFASDEEAEEYTSKINMTGIAKRDVPGYHAGDIKILDLNSDNVINGGANTVSDPGDRTIIGNTTPRYSYGVTLSCSWNGFDVYAFFQGIGKKDWYPDGETTMFWGSYSRPYVSFIPKNFTNKVWSTDNPDAYFPRLIGYLSLGSELSYSNDKYLQNAGYCKLRNLTIGYTLPDKIVKKVGVGNVRLYASGENLHTWTKLQTKYIDPEEIITGDARTYPLYRTYSFGVDITF